MNWLISLFCRHDFVFVRNFYGDEINSWGGKRSLWRCCKCGRIQARGNLFQATSERAR